MEKSTEQENDTLDKCLAILRKQGYKITPQRRAVLAAFGSCGRFATVQQLLEVVRRTQPDVSLDTIYRNLTLLAELGIVHEVHRPSGNAFEVVAPGHHHHHLVCTECGKTECINICPMNKLYEKEADKRGFFVTGHVFEVYGLCASCRSRLLKK
jgi:Fe2+ or Zn2+ uptake regulation protein